MKNLFSVICFFYCIQGMGQLQTCPININFSDEAFNHWFAYTGIYQNNTSRKQLNIIKYDTITRLPTGTLNAVIIPEYGDTGFGMQVLTNNNSDPFGNFETIPTINGYSYNYSVRIGSTTINTAPGLQQDSTLGGLFRGLGYTIDVPAGPPTVPYVVTYAYAMVLEAAPHENEQVPMFTAKLQTKSGIVDCANALYLLPTKESGTTFFLDTVAAKQRGFQLSGTPSPNNNGNKNESPYRVWTKGWTEVIFDLAPYRGQQVTLTFEADNCVPKGHFAYAYVALKNICKDLEIAGTTSACANGNLTYAIPELTGATYQWEIPSGWKYLKDSANTITVTPDSTAGTIVAHATNTCADLKADIAVAITPGTIPGFIIGDTVVCKGLIPNQSFPLNLVGNRGSVLNWVSSMDGGIHWTVIKDTTNIINAKNLPASTIFKAIVQNGDACRIDSSASAKITINPPSYAGILSPDNIQICKDQPLLNALTLNKSIGSVLNWQASIDQINWINTIPANNDTLQSINGIKGQTYFRAIVSTKGCPTDTSNKVSIGIYDTRFPQAIIFSKDTTICFGTVANLNTSILIGTSYKWTNSNTLYNAGNGSINQNPFFIHAEAAPSKKTDYVLSVTNAGCPNILYDTIHVNVLPPFSINVGKDTTIVMNQPLQLNALLSDSRTVNYFWTPASGLNNSKVSNPIAILDGNLGNIKYTVTATDSAGCSATKNLLVTVLKNGPEIYVPTAFTPNADGKNDILKPTIYGITNNFYFSIYNRWGQQVYFTKEIGKGWDGYWNGLAQPSGTYIFIAEGVDFLGNRITRKGTSVLIR